MKFNSKVWRIFDEHAFGGFDDMTEFVGGFDDKKYIFKYI
jgi:hypothetical protein